jgi:hypothetical protein
VTLPDPELEDGALADEELWPDELAPDDELVPDEEFVPDDELVPEPPDVACDDDPVLVLVDVAAALAVACVELGRVKASPPATASPSTPAPAVTPRSRLRARSRCTTADTVRGSLLFIMAPSGKLTPLDFRNGLWLRFPLHLRRL